MAEAKRKEPKYSTENLHRAIEHCKKNIRMFKDAIAKERAAIQEFEFQIEHNKRLKALTEARDAIEIVEEADGNQD